MSLSVYQVWMKHLADPSPEEVDTLQSHVYQADDGTYYLDKSALDDLKDYISPELHTDLQAALDADGDFNFLLS